MSYDYLKLWEPMKINKMRLRNRIMLSAMGTFTPMQDGTDSEEGIRYYEERAKGGAGLIMTGAMFLSEKTAQGGPTLNLYSTRAIPKATVMVERVHRWGAKICLQLSCGTGRNGMPDIGERVPISSSPNPAFYNPEMICRPLEVSEIKDIMKEFATAASFALNAGFDAVEIHGHAGYLIDQFISPEWNTRTDEYGGDLANRTRFALTLVRRLKAIVPDMVIDYKLPIVTPLGENSFRGKGGLPFDEACIFAKELEACGVDTLHVAQANHTGNMGDTTPAMGTQPYGFMVSYSKKIKELVSIPVSVVGRIVTPEAAEAVIANGSADIIGLGRSLLTDPDFANKCADGHCCNVRTCMMCNKGCTDNIQNRAFLSCVLNAENGYEATRHITPAASSKKIAIIGAGIAGLEAARVAALRGHSVTIFEKSLQIGGQLLIASVPPRKEEMMRSINYYANVLPELDVTFRLGEEFTSQDYNSFDEVIVATGANNAIIPVPGKDLPTVTSAWDVLAKKEIVFGNVSVIGGGLVGVETAEYLASRGCKVTIIEMMDQIAKEESNTVLPTLMSELEHYNVQIVTSAKLSEIKDDSVVVEKTIDDNTSTEEIASDFVVMAVGARKNLPELSDCPLPLHYIGDCAGERPSNIDHAIKSAYDVACEI